MKGVRGVREELQGGLCSLAMGPTSPWQCICCKWLLCSVLQPSRSSLVVISTVMQCILEPAFCCLILNFIHFLSLQVQGKSSFYCNWVPLQLKLTKKKKKSIHIYVHAVELAKKEIGARNKSLLFPLLNIFIDKPDLMNIIQRIFWGQLKSITSLHNQVGILQSSQHVPF